MSPGASSKTGGQRAQIYACLSCDKAFSQNANLKKHFQECHERDYTYFCGLDDCHQEFPEPSLLNQHHKKLHNCPKTCGHAETNKELNPAKKPRRGCGFCQRVEFTLDLWLDHLAKHCQGGFQKEHWNRSLVVYSLLSNQRHIVEAWKLLTEVSLSETKNGWQGDLSLRLQSRLETGTGTPVELAEETFYIHSQQRMDLTGKPVLALAQHRAYILVPHEPPTSQIAIRICQRHSPAIWT